MNAEQSYEGMAKDTFYTYLITFCCKILKVKFPLFFFLFLAQSELSDFYTQRCLPCAVVPVEMLKKNIQ